MSALRQFVHESFHVVTDPKARLVNGVIAFMIILSIAVIPLHLVPGLDSAQGPLYFFDRIAVSIFTIEYILRIWSSDRPSRYVLSWWGLIDLVAILPFYLSRLGALSALGLQHYFEVFLLLRILRILKLVKLHGIEEIAIRQIKEQEQHGTFKAMSNERVERVIQKHPLIFIIGLIMPLVFLSTGLGVLAYTYPHRLGFAFTVLCFAFAGIFFIKAWIDFQFDVIYVTNRRIIVQDREIFGASANEIHYEAITNVAPSSHGVFNWLFGIGEVQIETASQQGTLHFTEAPNPHDVVHHISVNRQKAIKKMQRPGGHLHQHLPQ